MSIRTLAITLAFIAAPAEALCDLFAPAIGEIVRYPALLLCLPAFLIGSWDWLRLPEDFWGKSWALIIPAALAVLSLLWVADSESGRGMVICVGLCGALPLSALVTRSDALRYAAGAFVLAAAVHALVLVAGEASTHGRLGAVIDAERGKVSNANAFAGEMALAAIVTVGFFVLDRRPGPSGLAKLLSHPPVALAIAGFFYCATLMSASRGGIGVLSIASIFFCFSGRVTLARLCGAIVATGVLVMAITLDSDLASTAISRFSDSQALATAGDRLPIWTAAWEAVQMQWIKGVGVGGVEMMLAEHLDDNAGIHFDELGNARKAAHNTYVEWIVSTGLGGAVAGVILVIAAVYRSFQLDRADHTSFRRALLLFGLCFSFTTTLYRQDYWLVFSSLLITAASASESANKTAVVDGTPREALPQRPVVLNPSLVR